MIQGIMTSFLREETTVSCTTQLELLKVVGSIMVPKASSDETESDEVETVGHENLLVLLSALEAVVDDERNKGNEVLYYAFCN